MSGILLHLLRHGAPEWTGRLLGRTDDPSTDAGISDCVEQAGDLGIERLVTSPLVRARAAADRIGAGCGLRPHVDPRWREIDFGEWDGLHPSDVEPQALARYWDDPDANAPPGGERWSELSARIGAAIADLECRSTLVITHGAAMRAALSRLCGFDTRQIWAFDLPYAALLTLRVWPGDRPTGQIVAISP